MCVLNIDSCKDSNMFDYQFKCVFEGIYKYPSTHSSKGLSNSSSNGSSKPLGEDSSVFKDTFERVFNCFAQAYRSGDMPFIELDLELMVARRHVTGS